MPNWCNVAITIESKDQDKLKDIWDVIWADGDGEESYETENANLMNLHPVPEEVLQKDGGRSWAVNNWGTKWEMDISVCELSPECIVLSGLTAWSPPLALLSHIAKQWDVTTQCSYYEEGMDFVGASYYTKDDECHSEGSISDNITPVEDYDDHDWSKTMDEIHELIDEHESTVLRQAGVMV